MKAIFTIIIVMAAFGTSVSQSCFTSVQSGAWNDTATWNVPSIPSSTDNVVIMTSHTVTYNGNAYCKDLFVKPGASLNLASPGILNVSGNWTNSGSFNSCGTTAMTGTVAQSISGSVTTTFYDLIINNAAGVSLNGNQNIKHMLALNQGTLYVSGFKLTLLSDSLITASIAPINPGADINGNISVQRYISSTVTGWRFLGSPVRTTLQDWNNDFVTSGFPGSAYPGFNFCSVYSYDETVFGTSDYGYEIPNNVTDSILPGTGYWCWVGPTPTLVEVTGKPGKFVQNFNVSLTPNAGKYEDGWNMLANPYPSAIDWDSPSWNKVGIQDAIYIWDPESEQYSTYINGIGINGGSNIIPSSRAFWVQANQNNPVLNCDESVKVDANSAFLRPASQSQIRLQLNGNSYADETVIFFSNNSTTNVNSSEDAMKLYSDNPLVPSINSVADSTDLAVNSLPAGSAITVPVKVKVGVSGTYTLAMNQGCNQLLNCCVFLEDLATGSKINLRNPVNYVFTISDTTSAPRFLLRVTKPVSKGSVNATCSYKQNGMALVSVNDGGSWGYTWKDVLGNVLAQHPAGALADTLKNLAPGTYDLLVTSPTTFCPQVAEQVIVEAPAKLSANINVSDNNCPKESNGSLGVSLVEGGTGPYHYNWSNGMHGMNIQALVSGVYTLIITDVNGCLDTSYHAVTNRSKLKTAFTILNDTSSIYVNQLVVFNEQCVDANNWLWNFGDAVSPSQNTVRMFSTPGTHTIELTGSDGTCSSMDTKIINVKSMPVANYPTTNGGVLVYNSGDDAQVKFDLPENSPAIVMVYTADGRLISIQNFSAWKNNETVKLGESHGIYVIRIKANGTEICQKLVK